MDRSGIRGPASVGAAHRDDHPRFTVARPMAHSAPRERRALRGARCGLGSRSVRLSTNRRIFAVPTSLSDAFDFLRAVRAQPGHMAVRPGSSHLEIFERTSREAAGDLAADAHFAALAMEHGAELVSFDCPPPTTRWPTRHGG